MFTVLGGSVGFCMGYSVGAAVAAIPLEPRITLYPLTEVLSTIGGIAIGNIMDLVALSTLIAVVVTSPLFLIGGAPSVGVTAVAGLAGVIAVPATAGLCVASAFVSSLAALGLYELVYPGGFEALCPALAGIAGITGNVGP